MGLEERRERAWPIHPELYPTAPYRQKAPHIGHQHHLCAMCENGACTLEEVKELVRDSKFLCRKCGRTAVNEENLCEPVPL